MKVFFKVGNGKGADNLYAKDSSMSIYEYSKKIINKLYMLLYFILILSWLKLFICSTASGLTHRWSSRCSTSSWNNLWCRDNNFLLLPFPQGLQLSLAHSQFFLAFIVIMINFYEFLFPDFNFRRKVSDFFLNHSHSLRFQFCISLLPIFQVSVFNFACIW